MPEENKWSTRRFDLIKGGVLLGILLLLLIAYNMSPNAASEKVEQTQAVATEVQRETQPGSTEVLVETQPLSTAPVVNQPPTSEDGTVSFSGSAQPGSSVELWAGDVKLAVVPVDASGNWAYTGQLPPGDYEIVARTVNAEGETVDESQAVAVQIDVPTPQAEAVVVQIGSISMETGGLVTLSGSTEDGVTVEVWAGETRLSSVPVQDDGSWSATVQLVPGDYLVAARSLSPEGEILGESHSVAVTVTAVANVTVNKPQVDASGKVSLSGTGEPGASVEILEDGVMVATSVVNQDGQWAASYTAAAGDHTLTVKVQGQAGEEASAASVVVQVPSSEGGQIYIVKSGDWLKQLARRFYGDPERWIDIYDATNAKAAVDSSFHVIVNPNYLLPGWKIWIPEP